MILLPAIDLYEGKVVRLTRGDYGNMTVYRDDPAAQAAEFQAAGAAWLHTVDLEGARDGGTPNFEVIRQICRSTGLKVEIGGGIRSLDTIARYLDAGVERVILGTQAVTDPEFLEAAVRRFGAQAAVGVDLKDGAIAIRGWKETAPEPAEQFFARLCALGVRTVICTDISRDGAMRGANLALYRTLASRYSMDIIASGGVSSLEDIRALKEAGAAGAIIGKAYYTGAIDLAQAIALGEGGEP